jgi:hypothetical protein
MLGRDPARFAEVTPVEGAAHVVDLPRLNLARQ